MKRTFSVIIIGKKINPYLIECIENTLKSSISNFEIIVILDIVKESLAFPKTKIFQSVNSSPAIKRDLGASKAKGKYLAFIDDDAYPYMDWLKEAEVLLRNDSVTAVCGPGVTPQSDDIFQKTGGWVNQVKVGQGPYTYRFKPETQRFVDDYPSMNFIIKVEDFKKIGGFDTNYWPGEDTKLCLDIIQKLHKKIVYDPKILVYHHRRRIFRDHLKQIGRYGLHRGFFAKRLPKTSLRISYFIPSLLLIGCIIFPFTLFINSIFFLFACLCFGMYILIILITMSQVLLKEKDIRIALLFIPAIIATHLFYGARFLQGILFTIELKQ